MEGPHSEEGVGIPPIHKVLQEIASCISKEKYNQVKIPLKKFYNTFFFQIFQIFLLPQCENSTQKDTVIWGFFVIFFHGNNICNFTRIFIENPSQYFLLIENLYIHGNELPNIHSPYFTHNYICLKLEN